MLSSWTSLTLAVVLLALNAHAADTMCNNFKATQHVFDSPFWQIHWVAPENEVAFVHTTAGGLYRTTDGGKTWFDQAELLINFNEPQPPFMQSRLLSLVATSDPQVWYLNGYGRALWLTTDAGATYTEVWSEAALHSVRPHPSLPSTLLGQSASERCFDDTAPGVCVEELHVSHDSAASWRYLVNYVYPGEFSWAHSAKRENAAAIWAIDWSEKSGTFFDKDEFDLRLVSSEDEFNTTGTVQLDHAVDFLVDWNAQFMLAAVIRDDGSDQLQLYSSPDLGLNFYKANFPTELEEQFYTWMDHSEDVVFVHVREHYEADYGHVYVSGENATDFALSLDYVSVRDYQVEFRRLSLIDGIYFANVKYTPEDWTDPRSITMMSHNKGASWHQLALPHVVVKDLNGNLLKCTHTSGIGTNGCGFHFGVASKSGHREQRSRGAFHSSPHAPGVALAVGNVGPWYEPPSSLTDEDHGTFITRDAGMTWTRVKNGSHIGAIGDQGNLFVLGDDSEHTREIHYSHDGGLTWDTCEFLTNVLDEEILINNIIIEPSTSGTNVLIFGSVTNGGLFEGRVVHIEFSKYNRECENADYEDWEVFKDTNAGNEHCFLGAKTVYKRRLPTAQCHSKDFLRPSVTPCTCAPADYECDFCYEQIGEGICGRIFSEECPKILPAPQGCETYSRSKGYRPIPGDRCTPGLPGYEPIVTPCQNGPGISSGSAWVVVFVILAIVAALICAGCVAFRKNQKFERFVRQLRIPGVRGNKAYVASSFADDDMDDDLLGDTGGYESN